VKRFRNLGIAAIAAFALTVVFGGSVASASVVETESSSVTLNSVGSEGQHAFSTQQINTSCNVPLLEGTVNNGASSIEASAKDSTCSMFGTVPMKMNGCKFSYAPGRETSKGVFEGMVGIGGAGCVQIEIGSSKTACWIALLPKTGYQATFENVGVGTGRSVKVTVNTGKLKLNQLGGTACSAGAYESGTWNGSWTIKGSSGGSPVGMWVKAFGGELPTTGLAIAGSPTSLTAGGYALAINGTSTTSQSMQMAAGKLNCTSATFSSSISAATAEFPLSAAYSACTFAGLSAKVAMNGCSYTLSVANHAAPFNGSASIACPAGKAIEIVAPSVGSPKCIVTIGAQAADAGGVSYTNEASSKVGVGLSLTGIDYHQQKGTAEVGNCTTLDSTSGTYAGSALLSGEYL
jgi:hypothetical protein